MVDMVLASLIGFASAGIIFAVGLGLSLWKEDWSNQAYCKDCCNPDHWSPEDIQKANAEKVLIFDDVSFCIGDNNAKTR